MSIIEGRDAAAAARWSVGGAFSEALANRDYTRMAITLAPNVRFRALLPPGPQEFEGPDDVTAAFRSWFGDVDEFELVDAAVGEVGGRLHLSWRIRVRPAPTPRSPSTRSTWSAPASIPSGSQRPSRADVAARRREQGAVEYSPAPTATSAPGRSVR